MSRTLRILGWIVPVLALGQTLVGENGTVSSSPLDLALSPDGSTLFVSDRTASQLVVWRIESKDLDASRLVGRVSLRGQATGVALARAGDLVYVAEYGSGTVAEIDTRSSLVRRRLQVGLRPLDIHVVEGRRLLLACNTTENDVSVVDLESGKGRARIAVRREPSFVAVTPDERWALVSNLLPAPGRASSGSGAKHTETSAAVVSVVDLEKLRVDAEIPLPAGSTAVRGVATAPDGRWAYVAHTLARAHGTTSDVLWVADAAISILDVLDRSRFATVLLSRYDRVATDPWNIAISPDGTRLHVTLSGSRDLAVLDLARLHRLLAGDVPEDILIGIRREARERDSWELIREQPTRRSVLAMDRTALTRAGVLRRVDLPLRAPRGIARFPRGELLAVSGYHSGAVALLDRDGRARAQLRVGDSGESSSARRGELLFHDATIAWRRGASCSTCHPDNGRTDALRWDLPNDGIGTPQDTRSLLWSTRMKRTTARGVRGGAHESVPAGLRFLGAQPTPDRVEDLIAYLDNLEPETSALLRPTGKLSEHMQRGRRLFEGKAGCASCHRGELRSDQKAHDIGTGLPAPADRDRARTPNAREGTKFVTPRLVELYRTAPYLHDGRAETLRSLWTVHDPDGQHGRARELRAEELDDLLEYLRSL